MLKLTILTKTHPSHAETELDHDSCAFQTCSLPILLISSSSHHFSNILQLVSKLIKNAQKRVLYQGILVNCQLRPEPEVLLVLEVATRSLLCRC
jgi:hypothetical protein